MALQSGHTTITDVPTLVVPAPEYRGGYTVLIENLDNASSVFLNGIDVAVNTGYELKKGVQATIPVAPDEAVYAICESGKTAIVCFLVTKR